MDGGNEQTAAKKFCFKASLSATETLVFMQKAYGNEALIKRFSVVFSILKWKGADRRWRERWPSKINSN
jgi:hypothetical protein